MRSLPKTGILKDRLRVSIRRRLVDHIAGSKSEVVATTGVSVSEQYVLAVLQSLDTVEKSPIPFRAIFHRYFNDGVPATSRG